MKRFITIWTISLIFPFLALAVDLPQQPFIKVDGSAEVKVKPEWVKLRFAIQYRSKSYDKGYQEMQAQTGKLLQFSKNHQIALKDIESNEINVHREINYQTKELIAYNFSRPFTINLRDLSRYDRFLDGLYRFRINGRVSSVFDVNEREKIKQRALDQAIEDAKRKANNLTKKFGTMVKGVYAISESAFGTISNTFIPNHVVYDTLRTTAKAEAFDASMEMGGSDNTFLTPNDITISSRIHVIFFIGPAN